VALDVRDAADGATLRVRVSPRASREGIGGEREGALVVRVSAPPVEGAANAAVARLVARALGVAAGAVEVRQGAGSREKLLHVRGLSAAGVRAKLEETR
jgi:uncharacterized protein (TIGR00251 family)